MYSNLVEESERVISRLSKQQVELKAQRHFKDAISFKEPDNSYEINSQSRWFRVCYKVQTSSAWNWTLFFLSFVYMYLIIGQPTNRMDVYTRHSKINLGLEWIILGVYWLDIGLERGHRSHSSSTFTKRHILKNSCIGLLTVDQFAYLFFGYSYPIRPFRLIRAFMPYFYESFSRKAALSLLSTYRDIIAYLIFYGILIFSFAFAANQLVNLAPDVQYDEYMSNYGDIGKMSFLIYVLASYDAWPDYELKAVDANKWNYILFVSFIFLNCFYFVTIPTTVIFNSFKNTRSKMVLADQIKQKQSLLLCYKCLEEDGKLTTEKFTRFMTQIYNHRPKYTNRIIYLNKVLDPTLSGVITLQSFLDLNQLFNNDDELHPPIFSFNRYYDALKNTIRSRLRLKQIIESDAFELLVVTIILANMLVIVLSFIVGLNQYQEYQRVFFVLFGLEMLLRMLGSGVQQYFKDQKNWLDLVLFGVSFVLSAFNFYESIDMGKMVRMVRLFRLSRLTRILLRYKSYRQLIYEHPLFRKLRILFGQLLISSIVGLKMFPIFCTCFYILSLIGMELFDNRFNSVTDSPYRYSLYDNYSSFRNLIQSQLVIVQVMIEAGWSPLVFDYSYRYNNFYGVCALFVSIHVVVVIILVSLMKGLVADLYETIYTTYIQMEKESIHEVSQQEQEIIQDERHLKQILIENNARMIEGIRKSRSSKDMRSRLFELNCESAQLTFPKKIEESGIQEYCLGQQKLKHNCWVPLRSSFIQQHLNQKKKIYAHAAPLKSVMETLSINKSSETVRQSTLEWMEPQSNQSVQWSSQIKSRSKIEYSYKTTVDIENIMRKVFLSTTSQNFKKAFEYEYLSSIYKKTIEYKDNSIQERMEQAYKLLGYLRKMLKQGGPFHQLVSAIVRVEEAISKSVIGKGCLFKIVLKIANTGGNWCVLEFQKEGKLTLQFIKSGVCTQTEGPQVAYWNNVFEVSNTLRQRMSKLADCFVEMKSFSQHEDEEDSILDPNHYHYNLYATNISTNQSKLIQKASVVVLTKGDVRRFSSKMSLSPKEKSRKTIRKFKLMTESEIKEKRARHTLDPPSIVQIMTYLQDILTIYWSSFQQSVSDFVHAQIN